MLGCDDSTVITIETKTPPALVAVRDEGSTSWQSLAIAGDKFSFEASGPYRVVVACEDHFDLTYITQYARTPDDDPLIEHQCDSVAPQLTVRGTMVQPGELGLGSNSVSSNATNWSFQLPAMAGTFDLVMRSEDDRLAIRREVQITADTQLGTVDLAQEGAQAMAPTTFTVANQQSNEQLFSAAFLETGGTFTLLHVGNGWTIPLAAQGMLREADHQSVMLAGSEPTSNPTEPRRTRSVNRDVRAGGATAITLPEPLGATTFEMTADRLAATLPALSGVDAVILSRQSYSSNGEESWSHAIELTSAFIDAAGVSSAVLELGDIPGFKQEWRHNPANEQVRRFSVRRGTSVRDYAMSSVTEEILPAAPVRAPSRGDAARKLMLHGAL